ncbi:MAG: hypothetical protein KAI47_13560, partial [Deltaproteobacteria bacterium]|nr:hypothetical protein [Deltaproteobacteria bacterium]
RHLDVGYVGRRGRRSLLWTSRHAKTEHKLLLGGGRELLNVNAIISYRIGDLSSYLAQYAKPDKVLEALAYRALLRRTAGKSLVAILTEDRAAFSRLLAKDLRRVCARRRLGVQILDVSLLGLHPPVAVASAYQGVVSAQLGIRTATIQAQRDAVTREERIRGRSREQVLQAEAKAAKREGRARGEAVRFTLTLKGRAKAPALYRFRKRLELLEARLGGLDLYVVDPLVATTTSSLWVDLRMIDNR